MTSQVEQDACSFMGAYGRNERNGRQWVNIIFETKLRYKTTAKTVYDQPGSTLDQKDRDQSKL